MRSVGAILLVSISGGACSSDGGGGITPPMDDTDDPPPAIVRFLGLWGLASPIPQGVQEMHAAVLKGRIYIAGGIDENNLTTAVAFRYDLRPDTWEQIADLPAARHHMPLAVVNDTLYAIGGLTTTGGGFVAEDNLWIYDETTDSWQTRTALPRPRGASTAGVVDGQIIVAGGYDENTQLIDSIAIYDPASNSWRSGAPIPTQRDHLAGAVWEGIFYVVGGRRVAVETTLATTEAYDITTDSWTTLPDMPTARGGLGATATDARIYALGGEPTVEMLRANEAYDITTGTWMLGPQLPTGRHGLAVAQLAGNVFAIGGGPVAGFAQTSVVEIFTPIAGTPRVPASRIP